MPNKTVWIVLIIVAFLGGWYMKPSQKTETPMTETQESTQFQSFTKEFGTFTPSELTWTAAPTALPAGAEIAVLEGNPSNPGPFTMRVRFPAGYTIAPHSHPADEHVTVISGVFQLAMGDTFDATKIEKLQAGSFAVMPAGMNHFARTEEVTVVQLNGIGPWGLDYVNPADDPRNK
jgi:quercetin dioxygenase-like cupin family protein